MSSDREWLRLMEEFFGDKTVNDIRAEKGLPPVEGGETTMAEWARQMPGLVLKPDLRLVPKVET
jgi:hypothetical protein